jgi:hypothetical protein
MSEQPKNNLSLTNEIKNNFLGIKPGSLFANYDVISDIHNYNMFISSFPTPANYLCPDSIPEDQDAIDAERYGIDPETLGKEDWGLEPDERYINLNMDIDQEPDEFTTVNHVSSDSESEDEWAHH